MFTNLNENITYNKNIGDSTVSCQNFIIVNEWNKVA